MKKKTLSLVLACTMTAMLLSGCGSSKAPETKDEGTRQETEASQTEVWTEVAEPTESEVAEATEATEAAGSEAAAVVAETKDGCYRSELTNEWIDESLMNQRPIAVLVDNEVHALPHYGTADADVVYEIMNSLQNNRVTRLLCIVKDWKSIKQMGNVRSSRPSFFPLAAEWNAVVIHDGGAYMEDYLAQPWCKHLSGGFLRVNNGKPKTYTEFISAEDRNGYRGLISRMKSAKISEEYDSFYPGSHFVFAADQNNVEERGDSFSATDISLPFPHNSSRLDYNAGTATYDYSEYGKLHKDAETDKVLTFENVILQKCDYHKCQDDGYYIAYDMNVSNQDGYYLTNGKAIPIKWSKAKDNAVTHFYDMDGNELQLNTGKTYIALVPSDKWGELAIK